jgi:hypothetical protein
MDRQGREALARIQRLVDNGDVLLTEHFLERMGLRGMFYYEALGVIEFATAIRNDGIDAAGGERWFVQGPTDAGDAEILVVVDRLAKFVTIYWI